MTPTSCLNTCTTSHSPASRTRHILTNLPPVLPISKTLNPHTGNDITLDWTRGSENELFAPESYSCQSLKSPALATFIMEEESEWVQWEYWAYMNLEIVYLCLA